MIVKEREPTQVFASVARRVKLALVVLVGVPLRTPVAVFNVAHEGNVPLLTLQVYGPVPPDADKVWLNVEPTVAVGRDEGETLIVGQ